MRVDFHLVFQCLPTEQIVQGCTVLQKNLFSNLFHAKEARQKALLNNLNSVVLAKQKGRENFHGAILSLSQI